MVMAKTYKVIDLFAGPGGLAEGFASLTVGQRRPFEVALSVEKEASAHRTLRLRAFVRQFGEDLPQEYLACLSGAPQPDWAQLYPRQWAAAEAHAVQLELGTRQANSIMEPHLEALADQPTVVIGGPPCQAYSVAGRVRNKGVENYSARDDHRHFLYREYIRILRRVRPVGFVMENVKGLLSSKVDGVRILDMVLKDLRNAAGPESYELVALTPGSSVRATCSKPPAAEDFLVRAEEHGVPQARHRIIIVGIRRDCAGRLPRLAAGSLMPAVEEQATVGQALEGIPEIRSGLSRGDSFQAWRDALVDAMDNVLEALTASSSLLHAKLVEPATLVRNSFWMRCPVLPRSATQATSIGAGAPRDLLQWLEGRADGRLANHESRGHMSADLSRYFFAAMFAKVHDRSPRSLEFPEALAPSHRNWSSGDFNDRFRVQQSGRPSSTVTSHIAKDGHYFIHPAPLQCRALTVREAARLQTFPDDYLFLGNRTEQYVQVGNAVPPFLARQIAQALLRIIEEPMECSESDDVAAPLAEALGGLR